LFLFFVWFSIHALKIYLNTPSDSEQTLIEMNWLLTHKPLTKEKWELNSSYEVNEAKLFVFDILCGQIYTTKFYTRTLVWKLVWPKKQFWNMMHLGWIEQSLSLKKSFITLQNSQLLRIRWFVLIKRMYNLGESNLNLPLVLKYLVLLIL
jgi:hypothetical protein